MNTMDLGKKAELPPAANRTVLDRDEGPLNIDLREVLQLLWRRMKLIVATVIIIMGLAYLGISSLTPIYTATVLVEIKARQERVVDFEAVLTGLPADSETMQTEIEIIRSRNIAERVVEHLGLGRNAEFNPILRPVSLIKTWRYALADWLADASESPKEGGRSEPNKEAIGPVGFLGRIRHMLAAGLRPLHDVGGTADERIRAEKDQIVDEFEKHLKVTPRRQSRIVQISFDSENPKLAAEAANKIADFYIVEQLEAKFEATKRATLWLNERVLQLREEVLEKERAIEAYRAESGLLEGDKDTTLAAQQISELNAQHILEVARLAEAQARLRQANKQLEAPGGVDSSVDVLQSELIRDLRAQEALVERQIAELSQEYGDNHPTLKSKRAELKDLQTKIQLEIDRVIEGLRNEVAIASARAKSLANSLEKQKQDMAKLNQSQVELRALQRDASASRTLLESLLGRTKETTSQESFQQADADIVSYAAQPRNPRYPRKTVMLAVSFVLAAGVGILLAFGIENWDASFRSGEQVYRLLGLRPLGLLPTVSKISVPPSTPHDYILQRPDSAFGEALRTLFTNLVLIDVTRRPKVIMMASALPYEGKTTVTLSLARSLAANGYKVIAVDGDLRNPTVHKKLGLESGPGLAECLTSGVLMDQVIQEDKTSGVHVLRAGRISGKSLGQFDSGQIQSLLRQLSRLYDIVLLDSAPVLAVSDSLYLAQLVDKVVFLIRWGKTRRAVASLALGQLKAAQADVAGVMLTMVDVKSHAAYGYNDSGIYHSRFKKYYRVS